MKILFQNKKIRLTCENHAAAMKLLGAAGAKKLRTRLADLEAATNVADLVAGNPHPLKGDRLGQFAVNLADGWRLAFIAADDPVPRREDASVNWSQVTIVSIVYIGDYHE